MGRSLGLIELSLHTKANITKIMVLMDIIPVNVLALLGLDVLDAEQLYVNDVNNRLVHRRKLNRSRGGFEYVDQLSMPINSHVYNLYSNMCFPPRTIYSTAQRLKLHPQFAHPSAEKLYALVRRAGLKSVTQQIIERLKEIENLCEQFQRIRNPPFRFRVSIGHENVRFNPRSYNELICLDYKPVLQIVDEATHFFAARFLPKMSTEAIWDSIVVCWSSV